MVEFRTVQDFYREYLEKMRHEAELLGQMFKTKTSDKIAKECENFETLNLYSTSGRPVVSMKYACYLGLGSRTVELLGFNIAVSEIMNDKKVIYIGPLDDFQIVGTCNAEKYFFIDGLFGLQPKIIENAMSNKTFRKKYKNGKVELTPNFVTESGGRWMIENKGELPRADIVYWKNPGTLSSKCLNWYLTEFKPEYAILGIPTPNGYSDITDEIIGPGTSENMQAIEKTLGGLECCPNFLRIYRRQCCGV